MRVGILGVAHIHADSYVTELKNEGILITGVYDHDAQMAQAFCQRTGLTFYPKVEELLASDCDTILICSENVFHKELAVAACKMKKQVIVEKPMALSVEDAKEMIAAAKEAQVKLMVAHPVRFSRPVQDLKSQMAANDLGKLVSINSSNHGKNPRGWFIEPELSGGGALIDHTVHISDLVNYLFELKPKKIGAFVEKNDPTIKVEDTGLVLIHFEEGPIMSLDTSWNRPETYPVWGDAVLEVVFERGYAVIDGFGRKMKIFNDQDQKVADYYYEENMDKLMIQAFIRAVDENLEAPVSGEDGLYTVLITQKAFEAAKKETIVCV